MREQVYRNPDGSFMNADEIADDIIAHLAPEDKEWIRNDYRPVLEKGTQIDLEEKIAWVHQKIVFGRWIRNAYGLWAEGNPHVDPEADAISIKHPDNYSSMVMDVLVTRLQCS